MTFFLVLLKGAVTLILLFVKVIMFFWKFLRKMLTVHLYVTPKAVIFHACKYRGRFVRLIYCIMASLFSTRLHSFPSFYLLIYLRHFVVLFYFYSISDFIFIDCFSQSGEGSIGRWCYQRRLNRKKIRSLPFFSSPWIHGI